ncbi:hypothetical protein RYA05_02050 [Pseudomonas syringae pv. actinidiae]|nr:hypothetical protein [Pseudomonas syringae pv. actinidiae]
MTGDPGHSTQENWLTVCRKAADSAAGIVIQLCGEEPERSKFMGPCTLIEAVIQPEDQDDDEFFLPRYKVETSLGEIISVSADDVECDHPGLNAIYNIFSNGRNPETGKGEWKGPSDLMASADDETKMEFIELVASVEVELEKALAEAG